MRMLRLMCGVAKTGTIRIEDVRISKSGTNSKEDHRERLKWYGHVCEVERRIADAPVSGMPDGRGRQNTRRLV